MYHVFRVFAPLIAIIVFINLYFTHPDGMQAVGNYPVWMKDQNGNFTQQTSGLCYVGISEGKKIFISTDDIGKVNRITVDESMNPPSLRIDTIKFSDEVMSLFNKFKKVDMEEIFYDKKTNMILLSIEGHEYSSKDPQVYRKKEGIYEMTFNKDILTFDTLLTIKRMTFPQEVYSHTFDNICFEGFAASDNFYFLGLENFQKDGQEFSDSTIIYINRRNTDELITIPTRELKISTISGLYAAGDYELYGIDRNRKNMFYIKFNEDFSVDKCEIKPVDLSIPGHRDINTIIGVAPEAITIDESNNIYVAIDPWQDYYKPDLAQKRRLSDEEKMNFANGVPVMYKFNNSFNGN